MSELREEDLILYFYGEAPNAAEIAARLEASAAERARYAALERVLRAADSWPAPEPPAAYGTRVWRRLEERLAPAPRRRSGFSGVLAWAAALVLVVGALFVLRAPAPPPAAPEGAFSASARARIVEAAVAHHLEQTERLLAEVDNGGPTLSANLESERRRAEELVDANRLYRQAAAESGLGGMRPLLEELEPFLLELAHLPATSADVAPLRERLDRSELLFKVRVASQSLELRSQRSTPSGPPRRTGDTL